MFGKTKRKVQSWNVIFSISLLLFSCAPKKHIRIQGNTQGTTYTILINEERSTVTQSQIDSILQDFDQSLSTYIDSSEISQFNRDNFAGELEDENAYFKTCYTKALTVFDQTDGLFDPSVFPLVAGWGFFKNTATPLSEDSVKRLLNDVGFTPGLYHTIEFKKGQLLYEKKTPFFKLDFNAIAQGYAVDVLADYLKKKGHLNFYIEIGGEIYVSGVNNKNQPWAIGIDMPKEELNHREIENIVYLSGRAIATSGNYRKFYVKDGKKYAHTIHPKTGFPVEHNLLSVTVVAKECAFADAYATAFMVMGMEESLAWLKENASLDVQAYFLYADEHGAIKSSFSNGFAAYTTVD